MDRHKLNIAVIGSSGAIGGALARYLSASPDIAQVHKLARSGGCLDITDEESLRRAAAETGPGLDAVFLATGVLHGANFKPEKSLNDLDGDTLAHVLAVNTVGPALVMKHFLPLLRRQGPAVFAALSARVGSISDNSLGGWYGYRASKAALNMMIKTASIEMQRRNSEAVVVGLHPGTVDSPLSAPYQKSAPAGVFAPEEAARNLWRTVRGLAPADSGKCFAYDGREISA